jgi:hypothetical protein
MTPHLKNCSPGNIVEVSETGYMNSELFVVWLKHFIVCVRRNVENKVLTTLYGHTTHSKIPEALYLASRTDIITF